MQERMAGLDLASEEHRLVIVDERRRRVGAAADRSQRGRDRRARPAAARVAGGAGRDRAAERDRRGPTARRRHRGRGRASQPAGRRPRPLPQRRRQVGRLRRLRARGAGAHRHAPLPAAPARRRRDKGAAGADAYPRGPGRAEGRARQPAQGAARCILARRRGSSPTSTRRSRSLPRALPQPRRRPRPRRARLAGFLARNGYSGRRTAAELLARLRRRPTAAPARPNERPAALSCSRSSPP